MVLVLTVALPFLSACEGSLITGKVETVQGEPLPGVAVSIRNQSGYALTDGLGKYELAYQPGDLILRFVKSGYAPAEMELSVRESRPVNASTAKMWRLPPERGVFLLENDRYHEAKPHFPERFRTTAEETLFCTNRPVDVEASTANPVIILHRMPWESVRMHRMAYRTLTLAVEGGRDTDIEAWVAADPLPVSAGPIDYPAQLLHRLRVDETLEPGVYAIHWGALEGRDDIERRMFLFRVPGAQTDESAKEGEDEEQDSPESN